MTTLTTAQDNSVSRPRGRLMFALDATASRAPTWVIARDLQAQMFCEAAPIGQLDMQLVLYRGDECRASKWVSSGDQLAHLMNRIKCEAGCTQIGRVLAHAPREAEKADVQALIFIGDAIEERIEELAAAVSKLGRLRVPIFPISRRPRLFGAEGAPSFGAEIWRGLFRVQPDASRAIEQFSSQLNPIARLAVGEIKRSSTFDGWRRQSM
jgi:hypothetical protein